MIYHGYRMVNNGEWWRMIYHAVYSNHQIWVENGVNIDILKIMNIKHLSISTPNIRTYQICPYLACCWGPDTSHFGWLWTFSTIPKHSKNWDEKHQPSSSKEHLRHHFLLRLETCFLGSEIHICTSWFVLYIDIYIYIYVYTHIHTHTYIHI